MREALTWCFFDGAFRKLPKASFAVSISPLFGRFAESSRSVYVERLLVLALALLSTLALALVLTLGAGAQAVGRASVPCGLL